MKKIARLEKWGTQYRIITYFDTHGGGKCLKNWTDTLCSTEFCTDEFFEELYFEESTKKWTASDEVVNYERNERYENNLIRAKRHIREYAMCNEWQYFVTLTLADGKICRHSLPAFYRAFGVWVGNYNKRYSTRLNYLIIPEQHKDGAYHAHGLFSGIAPESVSCNEYGYLDLPYYRNRFGFINLAPIRDSVRVANYITKYVTKSVTTSTELEKGRKAYLHSRGLKRPEVIYEGNCKESFVSDWSNEWCGITWGSCSEHRAEDIISGITRGINTLREEPKETVTQYLVSLQEWQKQYVDEYAQPEVYNGRVDILGKGE